LQIIKPKTTAASGDDSGAGQSTLSPNMKNADCPLDAQGENMILFFYNVSYILAVTG
jgi:hypothetical protein